MWRFEIEQCGRFVKTEWPSCIYPFHVPSSCWTERLWMRSTGQDRRREREWKEQVSHHPSPRFTVAILEKTIRLLKQWSLCGAASVSSWLFFFSKHISGAPCEITVDVRAKEVFPCGITAEWSWWKRRADRCWQKAMDNTCLKVLRKSSHAEHFTTLCPDEGQLLYFCMSAWFPPWASLKPFYTHVCKWQM